VVIAVDFDGTCVDHRYPDIGPDAPGCVSKLLTFVAMGHHIILFTMRSGQHLTPAVDWFAQRGIPLFGVNVNPEQHTWTDSPKAYAHLYIDDAAYGCPLTTSGGFKRSVVDWAKIDLEGF